MAVRYLASSQLTPPTPNQQVFENAISHLRERQSDLRGLSRWCRILMFAVGAVLLAAVAMLLANRTTASAVAAAGSTLVTLLLGFVSRQLRDRMADVEKLMTNAGKIASKIASKPQ